VAAPVVLLDAFSLLYRCFYALPPMSTQSGEPTSGVYGFAALLLKLLREERPRGVALALDAPYRTFRHAAYSGYKASRGSAPGALEDQIERFADLVAASGFPAFAAIGFEADDVLATLARELAERGEEPLVVSGDRDCLQIARAPARVLYVARGPGKAERYDEDAVLHRFGVIPAKLPDFIALVGDPSDELPGVPGIGPRTAAGLIRRFGSVQGALRRIDEVTPARVRDALAAGAERIRLWADLARLRDDVPLPPGPRYAPLSREARERLRELFAALEFRSLLPRIDAIVET
jgi:DNA polymerase I